MTGAKFEIDLDTKRVQNAINRSIDLLSNPDPVMEPIMRWARSNVVKNFEEESAPDGEPWVPSIRVLRAMAKGESAQTLTDKENLKKSITGIAAGGEAAVGTNKEYAAIHQFGGRAGRNHSALIPPRPFLGLGPADVEAIIDMVADHVARVLKEGP